MRSTRSQEPEGVAAQTRGLRWLALAMLAALAACGSDRSGDVDAAARAGDGVADSAVGSPFACGSLSCKADEYCVDEAGGGTDYANDICEIDLGCPPLQHWYACVALPKDCHDPCACLCNCGPCGDMHGRTVACYGC